MKAHPCSALSRRTHLSTVALWLYGPRSHSSGLHRTNLDISCWLLAQNAGVLVINSVIMSRRYERERGRAQTERVYTRFTVVPTLFSLFVHAEEVGNGLTSCHFPPPLPLSRQIRFRRCKIPPLSSAVIGVRASVYFSVLDYRVDLLHHGRSALPERSIDQVIKSIH